MQLLQDGIIAALAAMGLTSILWLLAGALYAPRIRPTEALALLAVRGAAENLEQQVRALERSRDESRSFDRILIVDCGLEDEARRRTQILSREDCGVELVAAAELAAAIT